MKKVLVPYYNRVYTFQESILIRLIGLFKVDKKANFLIMENAINPNANLASIQIYDIKGKMSQNSVTASSLIGDDF